MARYTENWWRFFVWGFLGLAGVVFLVPPASAQRSRRALPSLSDFEVIERKNLFHPDRTPQKSSDADVKPRPGAADIAGAHFVLHGVVLFENGKLIALLQEPQLTGRKVKSFVQGEMIGPYLLKAVKNDRVIMALEGEEFEVVLYKPKKPSLKPPRTRTPPRSTPKHMLTPPQPGVAPPKLPPAPRR